MASTWIITRPTKAGSKRYRVEYRVGGRDTATRYGGSFRTKREAEARRDIIARELAAFRLPDLHALTRTPTVPTIRTLAERWRASRLDVAPGTMQTYRVNLERLLPRVGSLRADELTPDRVAALVVELTDDGLSRESTRKTLSTLAQVLDHAGVEPNPVRSTHVKLPRAEKKHVQPPTADHVLSVHGALPRAYRLPLLVLDATGMRVGELEQLTWGDIDEARGRWRVSAGSSKTGVARWIEPPPPLFAAVCALVPREDRTPDRPVFQGFGADRFRAAITRACTATGTPVFSPHDLRHRRVSLLHLAGMPWARIGELVGHGDIVTTARTYTHVVTDEAELDYVEVLRVG